jgi:hypothetical protein
MLFVRRVIIRQSSAINTLFVILLPFSGSRGGVSGCIDAKCRHTYHYPCAQDGIVPKAKTSAADGTESDPVPQRAQFVAVEDGTGYHLRCPDHYDYSRPLPEPVHTITLPPGTYVRATQKTIDADLEVARKVRVRLENGSIAGKHPPGTHVTTVAADHDDSSDVKGTSIAALPPPASKRKASNSIAAAATPTATPSKDQPPTKRQRTTPKPVAPPPSSTAAVEGMSDSASLQTPEAFFQALEQLPRRQS